MEPELSGGADGAREFFFKRVLRSITRPSTRARFWESQIRAYEKADRRHPKPTGEIVFTGSSTIRFWKHLARDMAPLAVHNRGFGGAHMSHVEHFLDRIVLPLAPSVIVLYAGDNDLGLSTDLGPQDVLASLDRIRSRLTQALPEHQLVLMSIKPSSLRARRWPDMQEVNGGLEERAQQDERVSYVDIATPMLGAGGHPRSRYLTWDGLHPSADGYALFRSLLLPHLQHLAPSRAH